MRLLPNRQKKSPVIIFSKSCLKYSSEAHPESPKIIQTTAARLKKKGYAFLKPKLAPENMVLSVHNHDLVERLKNGSFFESSTPNLPGIYNHALLAAGGAVMAAELAESGIVAISLMRPPGHHAGKRRLGGFCYLNSLAIAVEGLLSKGKKIAILDFDCHHGNGTEEIFAGRENVIFISLHQVGIFPNTGFESRDNIFNFPMEAGTSAKEYFSILAQALEVAKAFNPDILALSAGFDAHMDDPLTDMNLSTEDYGKIGQMIKAIDFPTFAVLEGGYGEKMGECVEIFLENIS